MHLQKDDYRRSPGTINSHSMYGKNYSPVLFKYRIPERLFKMCQKIEKAYLMYIQRLYITYPAFVLKFCF